MPKSMKIGVVVALLVSGCASVPEVPNHVTFRARQMPEVQNTLIGRCAANGATVTGQTNNTVVCEKETSGASAVLAQLAVGNAYSTHPVAVCNYTLTSNGMDTTVYWQIYVKSQGVGGQANQMPMNDSKLNAQMAANLRTAGAE